VDTDNLKSNVYFILHTLRKVYVINSTITRWSLHDFSYKLNTKLKYFTSKSIKKLHLLQPPDALSRTIEIPHMHKISNFVSCKHSTVYIILYSSGGGEWFNDYYHKFFFTIVADFCVANYSTKLTLIYHRNNKICCIFVSY